jgi:hypothetical protein
MSNFIEIGRVVLKMADGQTKRRPESASLHYGLLPPEIRRT